MNKWLLLPTITAPMPFQMAFDEIVFRQMIDAKEELKQPFLRFYYSSEPWLTVGYSHPNDDENTDKIQACRRITGGGVVHHGEDLVFSIVAGKKHDESFMSVRDSYHKIHLAVQQGFKAFGEQTTFYTEDQTLPRGGECFLHPIESDLAYKDKKIAGGSQKRSLGVMLHQESIQLQETKSDRLVAYTDEIESFIQGFEQVFKIKFERPELNPEWIFKAEVLAKEKYNKL